MEEARILRMLRDGGRVAWQFIGIAVALYVLGFMFARVREVLLAVFVALVLAAIMTPVSNRLERLGWGRTLAASAALLVVIGVIGGALGYVGVRLVEELPDLAQDLKDQRQPALDLLARPPLSLSEEEVGLLLNRSIEQAAESPEDASSSADDEAAEIVDDGQGPAPGLTVAVLRGSVRAARLAGAILIGVVLSFFLVRDRDRLIESTMSFAVGKDNDRRAFVALRRGWRALIGYVRGSVIIGAVDALAIGAALFALRVPLAGVVTVLTFLAAFVPVVGATAAGLAAVLLVLVSAGPAAALGMLVWVIVVQQFDGNVLQPAVMAQETNLHPIATILALTIGGLVAGILGALLAVPVAAVLTNVVAGLLEHEPGPPAEPIAPA